MPQAAPTVLVHEQTPAEKNNQKGAVDRAAAAEAARVEQFNLRAFDSGVRLINLQESMMKQEGGSASGGPTVLNSVPNSRSVKKNVIGCNDRIKSRRSMVVVKCTSLFSN
jgi:hypothetical protein